MIEPNKHQYKKIFFLQTFSVNSGQETIKKGIAPLKLENTP